MADSVHTDTSSLLPAADLALTLTLRRAPNGIRFTSFGETKVDEAELDRIVQAVPAGIAPALSARAFYFVPLALPEGASDAVSGNSDRTLISPVYTADLSDEAICHRNVPVAVGPTAPAHEGVFISARLLRDNFALAFEYFINVGHAFAAETGIPESFCTLAWTQAMADIRGETSQDAWEARAELKPSATRSAKSQPDEKAKSEFFESAYADSLAIYMLSLAVDFDYAELREREYPLLAPNALADRLRLIAGLFPPNPGYEFSIRYRRRA